MAILQELIGYAEAARALQEAKPHANDNIRDKDGFGYEFEVFKKIKEIATGRFQLNIKENPVIGLKEGQLPKRYIVIGNHPSLITSFPFGHFVQSQIGVNKLRAVTKKEIVTHPVTKILLGDLLVKGGSSVVIDRDDAESAKSTIRENVKRVLVPNSGLVIFPDAHRPSAKWIDADRAKFGAKDQSILDWLKVTGYPRSGGLLSILEGIPVDERGDVVLADCTTCEPRVFEPGQTVTFSAQIHGIDQFTDRNSVEEFLKESWHEKNRTIEEHRLNT